MCLGFSSLIISNKSFFQLLAFNTRTLLNIITSINWFCIFLFYGNFTEFVTTRKGRNEKYQRKVFKYL
jgi:hypothetical protein